MRIKPFKGQRCVPQSSTQRDFKKVDKHRLIDRFDSGTSAAKDRQFQHR